MVNLVADYARPTAATLKKYGMSYADCWMYGHSFADLDGHQWEVLYMDESKMPAN